MTQPEAAAAQRRAPMQKVIPPRLVEPYLSGQRDVVAGYVYRAHDAAFGRPADLYEALDLGYHGSDFTPEVTEIHVMRWLARDIDTYLPPYGPEMGGDWRDRPPFAGNGFTSSREHRVPEFFVDPMPIPVGAEMYRLLATGEVFVARYDGRTWLRAVRQEG